MPSTAENPKVIAIMGATGTQGGTAVKAFHALKQNGNETFQIRAITRNPNSEKAKNLAPTVHEVVKADANDEESLVAAFSGCYGVFVLSNYFADMDVKHEMQILRTVKNAIKKTPSVKHIVISSFEDSRKFIASADNRDTWKVIQEDFGMYVPPFDGKAEVTEEFISEGLPVTRFHVSFYLESFINYGMGPSRQNDSDPYAITFPIGDVKLPVVATDYIGKAICAIFQDETLIGKTVGVANDFVSGQDMADVFSRVCGVNVIYNKVPWDIYASFGFPGAGDLANMFRLIVEDNETYCKTRVLSEEMKSRMGGLISFEAWVEANKDAFPKA